jgi:hypothetical protein
MGPNLEPQLREEFLELATAGMGKAIDRIPGGKYTIDKIILKTQLFVYEKLVSPAIEKKVLKTNKR